jgi:hypothetical protein
LEKIYAGEHTLKEQLQSSGQSFITVLALIFTGIGYSLTKLPAGDPPPPLSPFIYIMFSVACLWAAWLSYSISRFMGNKYKYGYLPGGVAITKQWVALHKYFTEKQEANIHSAVLPALKEDIVKEYPRKIDSNRTVNTTRMNHRYRRCWQLFGLGFVILLCLALIGVS